MFKILVLSLCYEIRSWGYRMGETARVLLSGSVSVCVYVYVYVCTHVLQTYMYIYTYRDPPLFESLHYITYTKDLHEHLFSLNGRNQKRTFAYTRKGEKRK